MSEAELVELIGRAGIDELTPRQCATLRAASRRSEAVRRACLERIALEQRLARTLGRPAIPLEALLAGRRPAGGGRMPRWLVLGLFALLMCGAAAVVPPLWKRFAQRGEPRADVAAATPVAAVPQPEPEPSVPPQQAAAPPAPTGEEPAAAGQPEATVGAASAAAAGAPAEQPAAEPAAPQAAVVAAVTPWDRTLAASGPPTEASLFALPPSTSAPPTVADLQAWLEPVAGQPAEFKLEKMANLAPPVDLVTVTGVVRLKCPLAADTALRLRIPAGPAFAVTAWSGNAGGRIEPVPAGEGLAWIGSAVTRGGAGRAIATRGLLSTSDSRGHLAALDPRGLSIVELRYDSGAIVLSRGEVRLAEVPLPAAPTEIIFEGRLECAALELVRSIAPPPLPAPPPSTQEWRPADVEWQVADASRLARDADGGVRLAQPAGAATPLVAMWRLPPAEAGPREIVVRLDAFDHGTGVCLAGPDGTPAIVCGFVAPPAGATKPAGDTVFMTWSPDQSPVQGNAAARPLPAPSPVWLRLRACGEHLCLAWSGDGRRFATIQPGLAAAPRIREVTAVGLFVGAHASRGITLSSLAVAELPGFAAVLPRPLVPAVDAALSRDLEAGSFAAWEAAVRAAKPADVEETAWLAAAAVRSLAGNRTGFPWELCRLVWQHARRAPIGLDARLAVCDDICRVASAVTDAAAAGDRTGDVCSGLYGLVAEPLAERGDVAGFLRARLALWHTPLVDHSAFDPDPLRVEERMLKRLVFAGPAVDLARIASRWQFYERQPGLGAWAAAEAAERIAADAHQGDHADQPEGKTAAGSHPLIVEEPDRAAFGAVTDLRLLLEERAWQDAQRAVENFVEQSLRVAGVGMVPAAGDRTRYLSVREAIDEMRRGSPEFMALVRSEHADRGSLRATQRAAADDPLGMEAVAIAFGDTPAAAEARAWLGFRSLAAGRFASARRQFQLGMDSAPTDLADRLQAAIRLADALDGRGSAAAPGDLPGIPAATLAELERDLLAARSLGTVGRQTWQLAATPMAPPPGDLDATQRLELTLGPRKVPAKPPFPPPRPLPVAAGRPPAFSSQRIDYAAEVCALTPVGDRLLVGNRIELCSIDTATGQLQWRASVGEKAGSIATSSLQPMRPVADAHHAYVRRLTASGPVLAAIRLADGGVAWEASNRQQSVLASDPVLVDGGLRLLEVRRGTDTELLLVGIEAASGRRLFERRLCLLAPSWRARYPGQREVPGDGQLATADGLLFAAVGGGAICCDPDGGTIWLRRQPWIGPAVDDWWWFQAPCPPLVEEGRVYVAQPGVGGLTALDAATGRLLWACPLPTVRRLVGMAGGAARRLVVETGEGLIAIDPAGGEPRTLLEARLDAGDPWLGLSATRLLAAAVATTDGQLIAAVQRLRDAAATPPVFEPRLVWIDVESGAVRHEAAAPALTGSPPCVGPLAVAGGRLWTLFQQNPLDLRRTLWELTPAAPR